MDKATVEFMCQSRGQADIVNALTRELDENVIGANAKTSVVELLNAVTGVLCHLREQGQLKMNFQALADATTFDGVMTLVHRHNLSTDLRKPIQTYLRELPGFPPDAVNIQRFDKVEEVLSKYDLSVQRQQHEYIRNLFIKPAIAANIIKPPPAEAAAGPTVRPIGDADRPAVEAQIKKHWADARIAYVNEFIDTTGMPGFVVVDGGRVIASLTYRTTPDNCLQVVTLASDRERRGLGTSLLKAAEDEARRLKLPRVLVSTDNSNLTAIGFYQKRGYVLHKAHLNVLEMLRFEKPTIPKAVNKIPLRDQLDFVKDVNA